MFKRLTLGLAAIAVVAAFGGIAPSANAQTKVRMAIPTGVNLLTSLVAEQKGYFKEEGIEAEIKRVRRGSIALGAMATDSVEFAESSHAAFFAATAKGIKAVAVGTGSRGFFGKLIAANRNAGLKTLADFKGKRIGIQVGTGVHTVFLMLIEKVGLKESDFAVSNLRVSDMPAAMASSKTFDAVMGWEPHMSRIVQGGFGKEVISARQFEQMAQISYPLLLSTRQNYRDKNPAVVQGVVNAYSKAHRFIRANKDAAVGIYMAFLKQTGSKLDEKTARMMLFEVDRFGGAHINEGDQVDLPDTLNFLFKLKRIKSLPDLKTIVDLSFGEKAKAAIK